MPNNITLYACVDMFVVIMYIHVVEKMTLCKDVG